MKHVKLFDTTLRDGLKIPGVFLLPDERIQIAKQLENLKVDVIEGGFPGASEEQYEVLCRMAEEIKTVGFCVLARATNPEDFKIASDVLKRTRKPRLHTFLPASKLYRDHFLKKSFEETLSIAKEAVQRGSEIAPEVEFSLVDAFRASEDEVIKLIETVLEAGAKIVTCADTVGYAIPWMVENLFDKISENFGDSITLSIHCHNDLGLAIANSLAALRAGASQVHCTINGLGERSGNTALEELVAIIVSHSDELDMSCSVELNRIYPICRIVERHTGISSSPLKPITGLNAFSCDVMMPQLEDEKEAPPFTILNPESLGRVQIEGILDSQMSYDEFKKQIENLGYLLSEEQCHKCYAAFNELVEKKEQVFLSDLELILQQVLYKIPQRYKLLYLNVTAGSIPVPHATVQLEIDGQIVQDAGFGHGPVDATFKTIFRMVKRFPKLVHYEVNAASAGTDAQGEVLLRLQEGQTVVDGRGANVDIVLASAHALVDALNKLERYGERKEVSEYTDQEGWAVML